MSKSKDKTLSEKLAELANPTPQFADPEDEYNEETKAQLEAFDDEEQSKESRQIKNLKSKVSLRNKNIELLAASDRRYAGKRVSRKDLEESSEEDLNTDEESEDDHTDDDDDEDNQSIDEDDEEESHISAFKSKFMKKVNRKPEKPSKTNKKLLDDSEMSELDEDLEDDSDQFQEEEELEGEDLEEEDVEEEEEYGDEEEDEDSDENEGEEEEEDDDENDETNEGTNRASVNSHDADIKKGKSIQNQLSLWDHLLECRIKLHKGINLSNQLPKASDYKQFSKVASDNHFLTAGQGAQSAMKTLLDSCLELQTLLLKTNPQTKSLVKKGNSETKEDPNDEEIPSDTEDEVESEEEEEDDAPKAKKLKVAEYDKEIGERHESFRSFCHRTLNMWNEKTKLAAGRTGSGPKSGFGAFDQSILKQIEGILADKQRLINRTRIKRSNYRVLGSVPKPQETVNTAKEGEQVQDDTPPSTKPADFEEFEPEIYDDDDFYHQLLRELIEKRTGEAGSNQVALGKQWLEIQKLRSKAKRKVDAKASKGRRLRYQVHPKLVSFMAPYPETTWNDIAKNELFASLFASGVGLSVS